jgi:hypothetical protein
MANDAEDEIQGQQIFEIILPLEQIPDGARVRKITGAKRFTVRKKLKIYGYTAENDERVEFDPQDKFVFLYYDGGVCAEPKSLKMVWFADITAVQRMLNELTEEDK